MAACTEEEVGDDGDGDYCCPPPQDHPKSLGTGNVGSKTIHFPQLEEAEMLKKVETTEEASKNRAHDLNNLSEDDFRKLLEEAATFNRPSNSESTLLQQLRREVAESDLCEDVSQNDAELNITQCVSSKKTRNAAQNNPGAKTKLKHDYDSFGANPLNNWNGLPCEDAENDNCTHHVFSSLGHDCKKSISSSGQEKIALSVHPIMPKCEATFGGVCHHDHRCEQSASCEGHVTCDHVSVISGDCREKQNMPLSLSHVQSRLSSSGKFQSTMVSPQNGMLCSDTKELKHSCTCNAAGTLSSGDRLMEATRVHILDVSGDCVSSHEGPTFVNSSNCQNTKCDTFSRLRHTDPSATESDLLSKAKVSSGAAESSAVSVDSLVEIEMVEIKDQKKKAEIIDHSALCVRKSPKAYQNCNVNERIQFYPGNCTSVDDPLPFPLKSIVVSEDKTSNQNRKSVSDSAGFTRSSPDSRYSVQPDLCKSGQMLLEPSVNVPKQYDTRIPSGLDVNGNQIICAMPSMFSDGGFILSSVKSSANENHSSKLEIGTLRKTKKSRTTGDDVIFAENISGHRGNEGIDSLLEFINSTDKKNKTASSTVGSLNNVNVNVNKTVLVQDVLSKKDKISAKETKSKNQKLRATVRKKGTSLGLTSEDSNASDEYGSQLDHEGLHSNLVSTSVEDRETLNIEESKEEMSEGSTSQNIEQNNVSAFQCDSVISEDFAVSSFASDFYAVTDAGQVFEESEFQVVINKHRKRRQSKKPEPFRHGSGSINRHSLNAGGRTDGIMLLSSLPISHRSQRNKMESARRKSTSSMPPSEHSSADNSDVDSVHSLPVGGSTPAPSYPHSHTTPSSTSLTPQTSYADIAKMSRSRTGFSLTSGSLPMGLPKGTQVEPLETETHAHNHSSLNEAIVMKSKSDVTDKSPKSSLENTSLTLNSNPENKQTTSDSSTVPSSPATTSKQVSEKSAVLVKITKESITQTDPVLVNSLVNNSTIPCDTLANVTPGVEPKDEEEADVVRDTEVSSDTSSVGTSLLGDACSVTKCPDVTSESDKSNSLCKYERPAVILMENCLPSEDMHGVTFGFEVNQELIKMTSETGMDWEPPAELVCGGALSTSRLPTLVEPMGKVTGSADARGSSEKPPPSTLGKVSAVPVLKHFTCVKDFQDGKQWHENSSVSQQKATISPHKDSDLGLPFNYSQIVNFIGLAWEDSVKDCSIEEHKGQQNQGRRAKYYSD